MATSGTSGFRVEPLGGSVVKKFPECRQLERELEAARADAELASAKTVAVAQLQVPRIPLRITKPAKRGGHPATVGTEMVAQVSTDSNLQGPRYGP